MNDEVVSTNPDVIGDFWAREVYPYLKPIVEADYRQEPSPIGSGVLVEFRSKQYLVTAGHVIAPHLEKGAAGIPKGAPYCFLPEQVEILGPIDIADDPFDIALIEVPTASRPCLKLPQHLALDVREGELCLFVGFQARENHGRWIPSDTQCGLVRCLISARSASRHLQGLASGSVINSSTEAAKSKMT